MIKNLFRILSFVIILISLPASAQEQQKRIGEKCHTSLGCIHGGSGGGVTLDSGPLVKVKKSRLIPINGTALLDGKIHALLIYKGYGFNGLSRCWVDVQFQGFRTFTTHIRNNNIPDTYPDAIPFQLDGIGSVHCVQGGKFIEVRFK